MPIRRLEEEGDRRAGTPPRLVAPRPSRAGSPALDNFSRRVIHHQSPRQRHADASTAEMIRFVRDYQLDRQPTLLRLQKRAPLPGIGQMTSSLQEQQDCYRSDVNDNVDYDHSEQLLDDEVAAIAYGAGDPLRHAGYLDNADNGMMARNNGKRRSNRFTSKPSADLNASYRIPVRPLDNHSHVDVRKRAKRQDLGRSLMQLPPIVRDDLPERPSAPSPSRTPPLTEEEDDNLPVDFIDTV
ncbi:hypothetical protein C0Q70_13776 [Pomacea canaliculata]|uniref:Uncharacterized protein n=2 Tax=Pomacea canaliculata TaxID=400727 RepID=A0A2T7NY53_POMCA|nr:uncharacterized protein LOC112570603 isoform X2 [Pomacea canaliculata]PVD26108.1 hypothetical protein C0Q70_13776 [Pomacea canaliculata]